jgi:C4-dicarboxylate-specific signal transduction histidine kinase
MAAKPPNVKEVRESLDQILREGTRAGEVVRSIRGLFTKHAPQAAAHDLNGSIREVLALLQHTLHSHQVATRLELAGDLREVLGDRVQLQQVILNLMLNAIEAMSGVVDRPRSLGIHSAMENGQTVLLRVSDSGVGLGAEGLERPFEPFFTTKAEGMGMGLSVSRSIVENHGGRLWASANEGPGATFHLSLPAVDAA